MSDDVAGNRPILVLSGSSPLARMMVDLLRQTLREERIIVIEERRALWPLLGAFIRRRLRQRGVASTMDALAMRVVHLFLPRPAAGATPAAAPDLVVRSVNGPDVAAFVDAVRPRVILLNICSLLSAEQLGRLPHPVLNIHNGINPRYRGSGNVNALAEDVPSAVGVTLHEVDAGIDTGRVIAVQTIDPVAGAIPLTRLDEVAFAAGVHLAIAHLKGQPLPAADRRRTDGFYPYPGLSVWLRAWRNLRSRQRRAGMPTLGPTWREDFDQRAGDAAKPLTEQLHWATFALTEARESAAAALVRAGKAGGSVMDIGCGDASFAHRLPGYRYVGCDACPPFLAHARSATVFAAEASALPVHDEAFDTVLAIGLFQHLDEAQPVADEMRRVARPGGGIVVSTLRQFTKPELALIWLGSITAPRRRALVQAIWRRRHGPTLLDGEAVARRYSPSEIARLFGVRRSALEVRHVGGLWGAIFAREIVIRLTVPDPPKKRRRPT